MDLSRTSHVKTTQINSMTEQKALWRGEKHKMEYLSILFKAFETVSSGIFISKLKEYSLEKVRYNTGLQTMLKEYVPYLLDSKRRFFSHST